jgi:beta-lactamase regulating signal transducer with metallopeptidase domain
MNPFIQLLGWSLVHALWQGCVLVLLAALVGGFLRSHARHLLNGLVLSLCLLLPAITAWQFHRPLSAGVGAVMVMDAVVLAPSGIAVPGAVPISIPLWLRLEAFVQPRLPFLVALWAVGASLMALRLGGGLALTLRWKRQALPAPIEWQDAVNALARRTGILRPVRLLLTSRGTTPMALGLWKPTVLLPLALLANLPPDYLEALLAHELAHVRRLDYLSNLLQGIAETLLFFHPAIWWLSARIRAEREELSDALAAQSLGDPRRLALALNALDDFQPAFPRPLFPALAARGGHLLTRIEHLLSPKPRVGPRWGLTALLLLPCAVLALRAAQEAPPITAPVALITQLDALSAKEGLDPQLLRSVAWAESLFNPKAKSSAGALGLLQVMPNTARKFGAQDVNDPAQVMAAGAKYLHFLLDRYQGDVPKAVAAYNCGEEALEADHLPEETTRYRALVLDVLKAKAVQPETPLAEGEVLGVVRRSADEVLTIQLRISGRAGLKMEILSSDESKVIGSVRIGEKKPDGSVLADSPWIESKPTIKIDVPKGERSLLIRTETSGSWKGDTRVALDAPWKTFRFRMEKPKS